MHVSLGLLSIYITSKKAVYVGKDLWKLLLSCSIHFTNTLLIRLGIATACANYCSPYKNSSNTSFMNQYNRYGLTDTNFIIIHYRHDTEFTRSIHVTSEFKCVSVVCARDENYSFIVCLIRSVKKLIRLIACHIEVYAIAKS